MADTMATVNVAFHLPLTLDSSLVCVTTPMKRASRLRESITRKQ